MGKRPNLVDFKKTMEALPVFMVLDTLYSKNSNSPVSHDKPSVKKYSDLVVMYEQIMNEASAKDSVSEARELPFTSLFSLSEMIVYTIVKTDDIFMHVMNPEYKATYLWSHGMNTAFISIKIGTLLELSFEELTELGVAALLHDIGMAKIHPAYYEHDRVLSEEERKVVETHPDLGHAYFKNLENDFPWLLRVILEEHQRIGEKGYPLTTEEEPHMYSKIIGLADSFESLTHNRSFRKAYHPGDAIKLIVEGKIAQYDKSVLKAMVEALSLFPVGSLVQLNTNTIAEVIRTIDGLPLRPVVKMVETDKNENNHPERIIDLSVEKALFITGLVYDERYYIPDQAKML